MGTLVNNKVSEVILPNVEATVEFASAEDSDTNSDAVIRTSTNKRFIYSEESSSDEDKVQKSQDLKNHETAVRFTSARDSNNDSEPEISPSPVLKSHTFVTDKLIDSDSSDDEIGNKQSHVTQTRLFDSDDEPEQNNADEPERIETAGYKLTPKDAKKQRDEIICDSQRRLRESRISLPYHKPKHRTLKEFFECRPKISSPLTDDLKKMSTVNAIKLASSRSDEITKKMEEREKIVEKFYRSDSDDGEEKFEHKEEEKENKVDEPMEIEEENVEEPALFSIQSILDEMKIDFSSIKDELIKSFTNPSRSNQFNQFEDQDDPELISQSDFNKIIDTLNTDEAPITQTPSSQKQVPKISDLEASTLVENFNQATENWGKDKCFDQLSDDETTQPKLGTQSTPKMHFKNFQPRLSGGPNQLIDLSEGIPEHKGVNDLVGRLLQHSAWKSSTKSPKVVEISITTTDSGQLKEETLKMSANVKEASSPMNEIPGAKLKRLREDLQKKIAIRRSANWAQKQKETKELLGITGPDDEEEEDEFGDTYKDEKENCCESDKDDAEEEVDKEDPEDGEDEEEEVIDLEEVENNEEEDDGLTSKERELLSKCDLIDDEADESGESGDESEETAESEESEPDLKTPVKKKKVLRRIKNTFHDESSDDETIADTLKENSLAKANEGRGNSSKDLDSDFEEIPLCQPTDKTPTRLINGQLPSNSPNTFLSPAMRLTGLQSLSRSRSVQRLEISTKSVSPSEESSPAKGPSPVKLFSQPETFNSQENFDKLINLCSGDFGMQTQSQIKPTQTLTLTPATQWMSPSLKELPTIDESPHKSESEAELKTLMKSSDPKTPNPTRTERLILSSDESSDDEETVNVMNPRKIKHKLNFTDEEEAGGDSSAIEMEEENEEEGVIEYDSEENEIIKRPQDFFDVEAELSEDEYVGSGDEAEQDLDQMEAEEGDADKINARKVQQDLERIHMRQVLDQDKREVRILQELYLEDGDLHSDKGRHRQFKWKNAAGDFGNDENVNPGNENDSDPDEGEDEQEEKWRRMRHERETFLREQRAKQNANSPADTSIDIPASPLIKMGPPLRKSVGLTPPIKNTFQQNKLDHIDLKKPLGLVNKKGSFLSRGAEALARLAAYTKESMVIGGAKKSRNFVFQTVEKEEIEKEIPTTPSSLSKPSGKRKAVDLDTTPLMLKKLRVAETLDKKVSSRVKRLFEKL